MTNKKINIAIAEHFGWRIAERVPPELKEDATSCWIRPNGDEWQEENLPNYCDLNAMHEAEKIGQSMVDGFWTAYSAGLKLSGAIQITHATASQRAEAFLKTIGKWENGK
jgi:hypothetical protein